MTQHIYAVLRSAADWAAILNHDPHLWAYDRTGHFPVEPEVLAARAAPNVWTESGWDLPPRSYPGLAIRVLEPAPAPASVVEDVPEAPARRRRRARPAITRQYRLPQEAPEQIDCLCEVYRLSASAVVARLIAEAYRRDVVESGALAILAKDEGIIAPLP